eukprot:SAG11_NODE_2138_length_3763_cov_2.690229_5_plen_184_part_00
MSECTVCSQGFSEMEPLRKLRVLHCHHAFCLRYESASLSPDGIRPYVTRVGFAGGRCIAKWSQSTLKSISGISCPSCRTNYASLRNSSETTAGTLLATLRPATPSSSVTKRASDLKLPAAAEAPLRKKSRAVKCLEWRDQSDHTSGVTLGVEAATSAQGEFDENGAAQERSAARGARVDRTVH